MSKPDRVSLYSELTESQNTECDLFERVLYDHFDKYTSVYNTLDTTGIIPLLNKIECNRVDPNNFEVLIHVTSVKNINVDDIISSLDAVYNTKVSIDKKKNTLLINVFK